MPACDVAQGHPESQRGWETLHPSTLTCEEHRTFPNGQLDIRDPRTGEWITVRPPASSSRLLNPQVGRRPGRDYVRVITTRRLLHLLAAMVILLVVGTTIGLIWADTSNAAGAFAGVTNVISVVGIVLLLIALAVKRRRRPG